MSRNLERRLSNLEQALPGPHYTLETLLDAARCIRAGGSMPTGWEALFTPSQVLRMAGELDLAENCLDKGAEGRER